MRLIIALLLIAHMSKAQVVIAPDSTGMYQYQAIIKTDIPSEDNYKRLKNYIALNYASANDVIQLDTKEQIILKGIFAIHHTLTEHLIYHTLIIDIKDQKIRITFKNFRVVVKRYDNRFEEEGNWLTFPNKEKTIKKTAEKLEEIIADLKAHLQKNIKDDW